MTTIATIPVFVKKREKHIRKLSANDPVVEIQGESWQKYLSKDADVMRLVKKFRRGLSRADVAALVPKKKNPTYAQLRPLFIATVMWGYGDNGFGAWRTCKMLRDPKIKQALPRAFKQILAGEFETARKEFVVDWCGPSFSTKFFYFIGRAHKLSPMPLILDSRVIDHLDHKKHNLASKIAYCKRGEDGILADFRIKRKGYSLYINTLNDWAAKLKVKPDQLELFLFNWE